MEPERIALSQRERDRLKVLHEVEQKHVTQVEAGRRLDVTDRQIRRLLVRLHRTAMARWCTGCGDSPGVTLCLSVLSSCSAAERICLRASSRLPSASVIQAAALSHWMSTWSAQYEDTSPRHRPVAFEFLAAYLIGTIRCS